MELKVWKNFSKKINSTKQPDDAAATTLTVYLKEDTSVEAPVFIIDGIDLEVNYCKWNGHYFFINDIVLVSNNLYELHCTQDVLATYKSDIQGYTGYVEYCDTFYNKMIPDRRLSMLNTITSNSTEAPSTVWTATHGTVVVTVATLDSSAQVGFTSMFGVSETNLTNLANWFYTSPAEWITEGLAKIFGDPSKAVVEAHWVPWELPTTGTTIKVGLTDSHVVAGGLKSYTTKAMDTVTLSIPWNHEDWRDYAPYSFMEIYLPFYGTISLDQSKFAGEENMYVKYSYDPISGEVLYNLQAGDWIGTYRCSVAVPLAIGQSTSNTMKGITEVGGGAAGAGLAIASMTGPAGATAAAVAGLIGGITSVGAGVITSFTSESSGAGGNGGYASGNLILQAPVDSPLRKIKLTMFSHRFSVNQDMTTMKEIEGRPWFQKMSLATLSGFVKCAGASVETAGLSSEREEVNQWLNQGIFIE